jgi:molybdenum cofactor guanylyltransferase
MTTSAAPLYGLILGGGRSRRMGVDKAALQYHGRSQTAYAYDLLSPLCEKTFVGIREDQASQEVFAPFPKLFDKYPGEGPFAAVISAQEQYPHAAWWILACDLPFLDAETLTHLLTQRQVGKPATAFLSRHDGRIEPLCAIYEPESALPLKTRYAEGLRCARQGLESVNPVRLPLPNPLALENANTPSERAQFLANLGQGTPGPIADAPNRPSVNSRPVTLHLYAQLREKLGKSIALNLNLPATESEVLEQIASHYPTLQPLLRRCRIAVDDSYLASDAVLENLTEIDVIAPVSGG